jgi:hypothetical protein
MTIEQRQHDAEQWAYAYADWQAADEQAHIYDGLRVEALARLDKARSKLIESAGVGPVLRVMTRVFLLPFSNDNRRELVKVTYTINGSDYTNIELLKTEPNE